MNIAGGDVVMQGVLCLAPPTRPSNDTFAWSRGCPFMTGTTVDRKDREIQRRQRERERERARKRGGSPGITVVECDCVETSFPNGQLPTYGLLVGVDFTQGNEHFRLPVTPSFFPSECHPEVDTLCGATYRPAMSASGTYNHDDDNCLITFS